MRNAQRKLRPEASTVHTSPFKPIGEETLQDSSLPQRGKYVKYVQSHQSTDAEHVSTVVQSIAPTEIDISRKIQISVLLSNTQTPGTITARNKDNGNNAPDSKSELREHKGQEILPKARLLDPSPEVSTDHLETASTHQLHR